MNRYKLFPVLFLSFIALISQTKNVVANSCASPTPPVCYSTIPLYPNAGAYNGAIALPNGDVILPNGSLVHSPTKQVQVSCSGSQQLIDYEVAQLQYSVCSSTQSAQNNAPLCIYPIASGCTTQNDVGAMTVQQNLYGIANSAAIQACKDQVAQYQAQLNTYNTCLATPAPNSSGVLSQATLNDVACVKIDPLSHYDSDTGKCVSDKLAYQNQACASIIPHSTYSTTSQSCGCMAGYQIDYSTGQYGTCLLRSSIVSATTTPTSTTQPTGITASAGTNILYNNTVYMVSPDGKRRPYTSAGAFVSYGFNSWSDLDVIVDANNSTLSLPVGSFIPPRDGKIICSDRGTDKGTCYLITDGKKSAFTSAAVFKGLGFSFSNALSGDVSFLDSSANISSSSQVHPAGVLVNKGGTVYLVGDSGLLGVPDIQTLQSWGYSLADSVKANAADSALAQSDVMTTHMAGALSPFGN